MVKRGTAFVFAALAGAISSYGALQLIPVSPAVTNDVLFEPASSVDDVPAASSTMVAGRGNARGFVVDALERLASHDPRNAFEQALSVRDPALKRTAIERIAKAWAALDAPAALDALAEIREPLLRHLFHAAVVLEWASADPDRALAYVTSVEGQRLLAMRFDEAPGQTVAAGADRRAEELVASVAAMLAIHRPREALAASRGIRGMAARYLWNSGLEQLYARDLPEMLDRLETNRLDLVPGGVPQRTFLAGVVRTFARRDPLAALEWARRFDRVSPVESFPPISAADLVLSEIARTDFARVVDLALADPSAVRNLVVIESTLSNVSVDAIPAIADKLAAAGPSQAANVAALLERWPERDPDAAWRWLRARPAEVTPVQVRSLAAGLADNGAVVPASAVYELPAEQRGDFVTTFASRFARTEPDKAVGWLEEFRVLPEYPQWAEAVARSLAIVTGRRTPTGAPELGTMLLYPVPASAIVSSLERVTPQVSVGVAESWARQQPREALQWALDLTDDQSRQPAVAAAIGAWTVDDRIAAREAALALPRGDLRDLALTAYLTQDVASHGSIDRSILDAFSSRSALDAATGRQAFAIAFASLHLRDPETATRLLGRHVDDAALRQRIRGQIDELGPGTYHRDSVFSVLAR